ncbi:unnamed protein product, partial [Polarella glacialis]
VPWHRQSFRTADKDFSRSSPVMSLAGSGDLERLGSSFANFTRFAGPGPPEEVLVTYEEKVKLLRSTTGGIGGQAAPKGTALQSSIRTATDTPALAAKRPKPSPELRRFRLAVQVSSPLYGVETQRMKQFHDMSEVAEGRRIPKGFGQSFSASEIMAQPNMMLLNEGLPNRPTILMPGWEALKKNTKMVYSGLEREGWDKIRDKMSSTH